jgi:signal transduction histidine kinase
MFSIKPFEFNLREYCFDIVNDIQLSHKNLRKINFTYNCDQEIVDLDEKIFQHILINLLSNAIKYSDLSTIVDFSLDIHNNEVKIVVTDNGIGIPLNEQDRIYDQFYRAKNVGAVSGTGLGMTVLKRSLDIIGGSIKLISEVDKGTTFEVIIPLINRIKNEA